MSQLKEKLFLRALLGAVIAMLICAAICAFGGNGEDLIARPAWFFLQFVGSAIFGAVANGSAVIYEIENWSILKATAVHYIIAMGAFVITSLLLDWFEIQELLIVFAAMTGAYVLIWLVNYIKGKREVRRMNEGLRRMRRGEEVGR